MQSRLAITASKSNWLFSAANNVAFRRGIAAPGATRRTADPESYSNPGERKVDPAVPHGDPEGTSNVAEPKRAKEERKTEFKTKKENETEPLKPPKIPNPSPPRLESVGAFNPAEPIVQQKRESSSFAPILQDVSCAGVDGSPLPRDKERELRDETVQELGDKEYYRDHKASPLSEIKFVDTRKPITRATDDTANAEDDENVGGDVIRWRPEQLDTAEEALRRAMEIFKQNAMRGDPITYPHSRILRELRGEWF